MPMSENPIGKFNPDAQVVPMKESGDPTTADTIKTEAVTATEEPISESMNAARELVDEPGSAAVRETATYKTLADAYQSIGTEQQRMTEEQFNDMLDLWLDGAAEGKKVPEKQQRAAELFDAELQLGQHSFERDVNAAFDPNEKMAPTVVPDRPAAKAATVSPEVIANMEQGEVVAEREEDDLELPDPEPDMVTTQEINLKAVEEAKSEALAEAEGDDPNSYRETNAYTQLKEEYTTLLGQSGNVDVARRLFLKDLEGQIADAEELKRPEIAEIYMKFAADLENESAIETEAAAHLLDAQNAVGRIAGMEIDIPAAVARARGRIARDETSAPRAAHEVANIDILQVNQLAQTAQKLEGMGWFKKRFSKDGKRAREAQQELNRLANALSQVERARQKAEARKAAPESSTRTDTISPAAEQEAPTGSAPDISPAAARTTPEGPAPDISPAAEGANDDAEPQMEMQVLDTLVSAGPAEVNSILGAVAAGELNTTDALGQLEDQPGFSEWKQAITGMALPDLRRFDGSVFDVPMTITSIRARKGEQTVYLQSPDGHRASMKLEDFFEQNIAPQADQESPALAA